jgi:zinc protease
VVKEERRLRTEDNPRALLYEQLNASAFHASPYRRPVVGWMSDLDAMTPEDARAFGGASGTSRPTLRWWWPGTWTSPGGARAWPKNTTAAIPARAVPARKPRTEPQQQGLRRIRVQGPGRAGLCGAGLQGPALTSLEASPENDDALALTVLAAVLDGYSGARLDRALTQGPDRLADSAGAGNGLMGRGPQLFTLDGVPAPGKTTEQVEAALRAQVQRIAREGVSEAELERVKTQWVASEVYKLDSVMNQARELGNLWAQGLPLDTGERLIQRLRQVSAAQVQAVAAKYFGDDQLTVAALRPQPLDPARKKRAPPAGSRH